MTLPPAEEKQRPAETLREGPLKATIWRNESENDPYHSVTVPRTYKDRESNLKDTHSIRGKDLRGLSDLARRTHQDVSQREREAFKEHRQAQD